jgi:hypothetical protein
VRRKKDSTVFSRNFPSSKKVFELGTETLCTLKFGFDANFLPAT